MTGASKVIYAVVAIIAVAVGGFLLSRAGDNCWSKYSTENEAIMNCEVHE